MTTVDCIAFLLTAATVWLGLELWLASDRRREQRRGKK